jgi:hypothetical protein
MTRQSQETKDDVAKTSDARRQQQRQATRSLREALLSFGVLTLRRDPPVYSPSPGPQCVNTDLGPKQASRPTQSNNKGLDIFWQREDKTIIMF